MRIILLRTVLMLVLIFFMTEPLSAQNPTKINDLVFGSMFPSIPKSIDKKTAGEAAEFHISGNPGDEIIFTFTLPTYLYQGGYNYQLVFSSTDCSIDTSATPSQSSPIIDNLNPWQSQTHRLGSSGMTIWLGGTAIPKLIQQAGDYAATIVLTVDTTGN